MGLDAREEDGEYLEIQLHPRVAIFHIECEAVLHSLVCIDLLIGHHEESPEGPLDVAHQDTSVDLVTQNGQLLSQSFLKVPLQ